MEVTTDNFQEVLPLIYAAIDKADFVAFDTELTGLRHSGNRYNELDSSEERYTKIRESARDFGMIQFGMTTFRYIKERTTYSHATFCFYLHGRDGEIMSFDNSSLRFLANNGFDFNKLYKCGLPFMSLQEEASERSSIQKDTLEPLAPSPVKVAEEGAKKFLREAEKKMSEFMADESSEVFVFPGANLTGFFRKLLYNNIAAKYENILIRPVVGSSERSVEIRKFPSQKARSTFLEEEREKKINEKFGFTHVVRRVLERGCPLVGHNMALDIFHTFHKMIRPLPETLHQFKAEVRSTLPTVYDTKLISKDPPFCTDIPITALEILYSALCKNYSPPPLEVEEEGEEGGYLSHQTSEGGGGRAHDAGYDAFMTGISFLTMVKELDGGNWKQKGVIHSKHLPAYANKINNMNSYDIPYLNMVGAEVQPNRSQVFCVECPASWSSVNVYGLFHMLKPIKVVWVNSSSLYVIPIEDMDSKAVKQHLKAVQASCPPLVRVRLYTETHQHLPAPKRKSQSSEDGGGGGGAAGGEAVNPARIHEYKRLKSVGSDQLSQMSLESPSMEEAPPLTTAADGDLKKTGVQGGGAFSVPDEW